jgi:hypothetical protein
MEPDVHYHRVHKSPPLDSILSQQNPVHTLAPYFFKIWFDIYLPYTSRSSGFPAKIVYACLISVMTIVHSAPLISLGLIVLIIWNLNCKAPHYAIFSILLLLPPSSVQIFSILTKYM